jgi:hypothetical protein
LEWTDCQSTKYFFKGDVPITSTGLLPAGAELAWYRDNTPPGPDNPSKKVYPKGDPQFDLWKKGTGWISLYAFLRLATRPDNPATVGLDEFLYDTGYFPQQTRCKGPGDPIPNCLDPAVNLPLNPNNLALEPADNNEPWGGITQNVSRIEAFIYTDGAVTGVKQSAEGLNNKWCVNTYKCGDACAAIQNVKMSAERYGYHGSESCTENQAANSRVDCGANYRKRTPGSLGGLNDIGGSWSEGAARNYGPEVMSNNDVCPNCYEVGDRPEGCPASGQPEETDGITIVGGVIGETIDLLAPGGFYVCYDDRVRKNPFVFKKGRVLEMGPQL